MLYSWLTFCELLDKARETVDLEIPSSLAMSLIVMCFMALLVFSKINYLESLCMNTYQTPAIEVLSISLEQPVLTASGNVFSGNGPEGYDIDDADFNW